jgi:hypothetical protein
VTGGGGDRGGLGALARDVAEDGRPDAVAALEDVEEVAADHVLVAGGQEDGRELDAGYLGELTRQQAGLQRLRYLGALRVQAGVGDVQACARRNRLGQHEVVVGEAAAGVAEDQRQRADHLALRARNRPGPEVADAQPLQQPGLLAGLGDRREPRRRDVRDQLGLAGLQDRRRARTTAGLVPASELRG